MIYALQKNSVGTVVSCSSWSDLPVAPGGGGAPIIPEGFVECDAETYTAAVAAMLNTMPIKAQNALASVQQQAVMTVAMGGTFSAAMQTYVKELQAIADGTDTTSTALPTAPSS